MEGIGLFGFVGYWVSYPMHFGFLDGGGLFDFFVGCFWFHRLSLLCFGVLFDYGVVELELMCVYYFVLLGRLDLFYYYRCCSHFQFLPQTISVVLD